MKNGIGRFLGNLAVVLAAWGTARAANDLVAGNLIQFSDNGAWCWYQDERAVVDVPRGKLAVAALANRFGTGGTPKDGDVDVTLFDLPGQRGPRTTLKEALLSYGGGDDHNVAALLIRPSGGYLAMYAGHNNDFISFYRNYNTGTGVWAAERQFDWNTMPGGTDFQTSYSNLFYLSSESRTYNFARTDGRSPNFMISSDEGVNWTYGGQLTQPDTSIGYVNGYFKYSSNGVDRIDFIATEHHPRDYNTSIYHGYVRTGRSYNSIGTQIDANISDKTSPYPIQFTRVFAANTVVNGTTMTRCWTIDLQGYSDGTIASIFKCRANNVDTDHRFLFTRFSGGVWRTSYLARAGARLFTSEQDYTGLGALHPNDPSVIFISTPVDPITGAALTNHEIFKGVTSDNGATWTWSAITQLSTRDNLRPIIPSWDANHTAVLWFRGTMTSSQNFDAAIVGVMERSPETTGPMVYLDASASNTSLSTGGALTATGPSATTGAADGQWHWRSGNGNGGSVLASAEAGGENAPALRTQATVATAGTYDVWANFWADPVADWRMRAGLSTGEMQLFRHMASRQVESGDHATAIVITGGTTLFLYQAYLGRVQIAANGTLDVFVDDDAIQTGTTATLIGNTARTWYDGISFAPVNGVVGIKQVRKARGIDYVPGYRDLRGRKIQTKVMVNKTRLPIP